MLILADLDRFKRINDCHGHEVGDRVLKATGDGLRRLVRDADFVARFGGDEFALLLPHADHAAGVAVALRICRAIAGKAFSVSVRGGEVSASLSMGVAAACDGDTDDSILSRADRAMYGSKRGGGNRVLSYEPKQESPPLEACPPASDQPMPAAASS